MAAPLATLRRGALTRYPPKRPHKPSSMRRGAAFGPSPVAFSAWVHRSASTSRYLGALPPTGTLTLTLTSTWERN